MNSKRKQTSKDLNAIGLAFICTGFAAAWMNLPAAAFIAITGVLLIVVGLLIGAE